MVGREGQRIALGDLLLNHGPNGAFLVTGQRGAGKTSFVRDCLRQYENDVFARALQSNVGRSVYWDRIVFLGLGALGLALLMMAHELLDALMIMQGQSPAFHLWLAIIPLVVICGTPIIYALRLFDVCLDSPIKGPLAFLLTIGVGLLALILSWAPPVRSVLHFLEAFNAPPSVIMSRILVMVTGYAATIQWASFGDTPKGREPGAMPIAEGRGVLQLVGWLAGLAMPFGMHFLVQYCFGSALGTESFWPNISLAFGLMGAFLLLNKPRDAGSRSVGWYWIGISVCAFSAVLASWFAIVDAGGGSLFDEYLWIPMATIAIPYFLAWMRANGYSDNRVRIPQPRLTLLVKATVACAFGVQLAQPILNLMIDGVVGFPVAPEHRMQLDGRWLLAALLTALALARAEYQWIVGPYAWIRDDRARDLSRWVERGAQPDPQDESRRYHDARRHHLRYVRHTFHWMFYSNWIQVIVVNVNLGFDKLEHGHVVHAMLAGLREIYQRRFLNPLGSVAIVSTLIKSLVVVVISTILSGAIFGAEPDDIKSVEDGQSYLSSSDSSKPGSVLRLFEGHPNLARFFYFPIVGGDQDIKTQGGLMLCMALPCHAPVAAPVVAELLIVERDAIRNKLIDELFDASIYGGLGGLGGPGQATLPGLAWYAGVFRVVRLYVLTGTAANTPVRLAKAIARSGRVIAGPARKTVIIRIHDVVVFLIMFGVTSIIVSRLEITPYRPLHNRIENTLNRLSGKTAISMLSSRILIKGGLGEFGFPNQTQSHEANQADPREIENALMTILEEIRSPRLALLPDRRLHLPAPEVTFVFDELDKLGMRAVLHPDESGGAPATAKNRVRSAKIHQLFAELKNLLSSAPARFIMVGGRDLHDEWLTDQAMPTPLLTSIFKGVIYLPSLLVDEPDANAPRRWRSRVDQYVKVQKRRSDLVYEQHRDARRVPGFGLTDRLKLPMTFVQPERYEDGHENVDVPVNFFRCDDGTEVGWSDELKGSFLDFMTFRSIGNPKKLKELLESFIRPTGRFVSANVRWKPGTAGKFDECDHVLLFDDDEIFRVQLVSALYRELSGEFENRHAQRDDKLVTALFHFSDFVFKFHHRAFSWSNLERVEELAHAHRTPEHRNLLESVVELLSERMLHPILNGLYAYRFRSDMACEIAYISRRSKEEMAAFNFTLDESQALKDMYHGYIMTMKPRPTADVFIGLGELHDFDQDFELARHYYERAIDAGDEAFVDLQEGGLTGIDVILSSSPTGMRWMRQNMAWATTRLRIMLQIGLTFEISRNLERASVLYRDARTLARALLRAYIDDEGRLRDRLWDLPEPARAVKTKRVHSLKHLNVIYEATFAEAWAAEKMTEAVDTSVTLVEREIYGFRRMLPFVREAWPELQASIQNNQISPIKSANSNFSLSMAEIHSSAGDLYFFKGRQHIVPADVDKRGRADGYLQGAYFHYAMCMHDLRRYITYRIASSGARLNIYDHGPTAEATLESRGWSDFMFRAVGGGLGDLADTMLGQVSFFGLMGDLKTLGDACVKHDRAFVDAIVQALNGVVVDWLEGRDASGWPDFCHRIRYVVPSINMGPIEGWLGKPNPTSSGVWHSDGVWLTFDEGMPRDIMRFTFALLLSISAADMLAEGGYPDETARELLQVSETIHHFMSWASGVSDLSVLKVQGSNGWRGVAYNAGVNSSMGCSYWCFLLELSLYSAEKTQRLLMRRKNMTDSTISLTYSLCSLRLAASARRWSCVRDDRTWSLIDQVAPWTKPSAGAYFSGPDGARGVVKEAVDRYRYPALTRMRGIKLLIDDGVIYGSGSSLNAMTGSRACAHCCVFADPQFVASAPRAMVDVGDIQAQLDELIALNEQMQAPLHFTPMHMGVTLSQFFLRYPIEQHESYGRLALRFLDASLEVTTMRRAYYECITRLYYLYDDFNDGQIHYNHAIQMAGYQYVLLLREAVEAELEKL